MLSSSTASRLDALAGLEGAKRLVKMVASGDTGVHAVLLYGAPGSGKAELAGVLTQAWLCHNLQPGGACGECKGCQAYFRNLNADVLHVTPQGPSNLIKIAQITPRETEKEILSIQEFLRTPPLYGRNKVVVMIEADRMNNDAASSLLKTLEEPHPHNKLVLTTSSIGLILPTVLSRCLAVACELPESRQPEFTERDWRLAQGAPGRAAEIAANAAIYHAIDDLARSLPDKGPEAALSLTDELRKISERLENKRNCGMRAAYTEALAVLGISLSQIENPCADWGQATAEAHKRIQGNGNATFVLDALFARILTV